MSMRPNTGCFSFETLLGREQVLISCLLLFFFLLSGKQKIFLLKQKQLCGLGANWRGLDKLSSVDFCPLSLGDSARKIQKQNWEVLLVGEMILSWWWKVKHIYSLKLTYVKNTNQYNWLNKYLSVDFWPLISLQNSKSGFRQSIFGELHVLNVNPTSCQFARN